MIKADQYEYEKQLQKDYEKMKSIVDPLLHNRGPGWISASCPVDEMQSVDPPYFFGMISQTQNTVEY